MKTIKKISLNKVKLITFLLVSAGLLFTPLLSNSAKAATVTIYEASDDGWIRDAVEAGSYFTHSSIWGGNVALPMWILV